MLGNAIRNGAVMRGTLKIERDSPAARKPLPVELEPPRLAAARKPAACDNDIGVGAATHEGTPLYGVAASQCQHAPGAAIPNDIRNAGVPGASRERLCGKRQGITIEGGGLADQAPDEIAAAIPKQDRNPVLSNDCKVLAVPRH